MPSSGERQQDVRFALAATNDFVTRDDGRPGRSRFDMFLTSPRQTAQFDTAFLDIGTAQLAGAERLATI
jgi:hypothetical protein